MQFPELEHFCKIGLRKFFLSEGIIGIVNSSVSKIIVQTVSRKGYQGCKLILVESHCSEPWARGITGIVNSFVWGIIAQKFVVFQPVLR